MRPGDLRSRGRWTPGDCDLRSRGRWTPGDWGEAAETAMRILSRLPGGLIAISRFGAEGVGSAIWWEGLGEPLVELRGRRLYSLGP